MSLLLLNIQLLGAALCTIRPVRVLVTRGGGFGGLSSVLLLLLLLLLLLPASEPTLRSASALLLLLTEPLHCQTDRQW